MSTMAQIKLSNGDIMELELNADVRTNMVSDNRIELEGTLLPITGPRDINYTVNCKLTEEGQQIIQQLREQQRRQLIETRSMAINRLLGRCFE